MSPKPEPDDKVAAELDYDIESDRAIMFGGCKRIENPQIGETWAYDHNTATWQRMANGPSNHLGGRMAYDAESDRMILFGGFYFVK